MVAPFFVFDIETGPLDSATIWRRTGHSPLPPIPREFDEAAVKVGNLKDPAKIAEKIASARETHVACEEGFQQGHTAVLAEAIDKAALDARTGQVLAIGTIDNNRTFRVEDATANTEVEMLETFWEAFERALKLGARMVGHNIFEFDLPFLVRRSWMCKVPVPSGVYNFDRRRWHELFYDTGAAFSLGQHSCRWIKLDDLADFFDGPMKTGSGKDFHLLLQRDPEEAREYLRNDLRSTLVAATAMGLV